MSPPGRLSEPRKREIYEAVLEFLREVGYQGLSMPALAARARCSTATIYRQWQGKAGLVIAALTNRQPELAADVDTGSLAGGSVRARASASGHRIGRDRADGGARACRHA